MRIVYLGTPEFAVEPLKAILLDKSIEVVGVVCNPDKPFGRKKILTAPPVKQFAVDNGLPVYQFNKIREEGVGILKNLAPDFMVTCAYGQILSQEILDIAKYGVINIHASLLPKYRGASPIHYAIKNGEKVTGVTIMRSDKGIDTGDIITFRSIEILENETTGELFERLSILGAEMIVKALHSVFDGSATFTPQEHSKATLTKIIKKEDARIDWSLSAEEIVNHVRAFNPAPIAYTLLYGEPFKVYSSKKAQGKGEIGEIISNENSLVVACGDGAVELLMVQKAGGKAMRAEEFLRGAKIALNTKFVWLTIYTIAIEF